MIAAMPTYAFPVAPQVWSPYPCPNMPARRVADSAQEAALKASAEKIEQSLTLHTGIFGEHECQRIEEFVDVTAMRAATGQFRGQYTVDATPHRTKYFFGNGYTYGHGKRGNEELLPVGAVDPIPVWIEQFVVQPLVEQGIVSKGWIDSVVMNDYQYKGQIVAHVDPPQLFERPILTASFFCPAQLVFGASFDPERTQPPVYVQPLPRGSVLLLDGYAANDVTHGMRPEDMFGTRRCSIVLRHVRRDAPKLGFPQVQDPQRRCLGEEERSRLIREAQGSWRDPTNTIFYEVQQLSVEVWKVSEGAEEREHKATWRMYPREHGLVCNGGVLDSIRGSPPERLEWKPLNKQENDDHHHYNFAFVWQRADNQASD